MGRYRRYRSSRRSSYGYDRAIQHIHEAKALSRELGGTDSDVKEFFFKLSPDQLARVLTQYGIEHGNAAREYAEKTIRKWQTGRVQMSGMVAERLFKLLPPIMPLDEKYRLTENLWRHVGPSSKRLLRVGLNANVDDAIGKVKEHIEEVVTNYKIPDSLARRFEWISSGDVGVKQQLLSHLQTMEKTIVIEAARQQLPVMLQHLGSAAGNKTTHIAQILKVGKHELEIRIDRDASGTRLENWKPPSSTSSHNYQWVWWILGIGALLFFILRK